MTDHPHSAQERPPQEAKEYLADRLDGARDLYLLALALGERGGVATLFGRMIREARIHFTALIEECRIAGLDTSAIAMHEGSTMYRDMNNGIQLHASVFWAKIAEDEELN